MTEGKQESQTVEGAPAAAAETERDVWAPGETPASTELDHSHLLRVEERLRAPHRGDVLSGTLLGMAVVLFALALSALTNLAIIKWHVDSALGKLNWLSVVIIVVVLLWTVLKDWRWLHSEETDIARLVNDPAVQRRPEMVLSGAGGSGGKPRVETLLDDRVSRMLRARRAPEDNRAGALVQENELRAVAVWRSATLGSLARYASGLLLLLTVFGTFLGVKTALPKLQQAMAESASGATTTDTSAQLAQALGQVADAFGSNLTALVGAIAMGLVAWALSVGRQNMLARLEHVSSLYVYPHARKRSAVELLTGAAERIARAGDGLDTAARELGAVNATIRDELRGVRDAVSDFSAPIADSMEQTRRTLKILLEEQRQQVAEEGRRTVDKIERQITDTTTAVQQATAIYGNMVGRLESDMRVIADTSASLRAAIVEMQEARQAFGRYADSATRAIQERLDSLEKASTAHLAKLEEATARHLSALETASTGQLDVSRRTLGRYRRIDRNLTVLVAEVTRLADNIGTADQRRQEMTAELEERTARRVTEHLGPSIEKLDRSTKHVDDAVSGLPRSVADGVRDALKGTGAVSTDPGPALRRLVELLAQRESRAAQPLPSRLLNLLRGSAQ